jgi:hypothetical protein
MSWPLALCCLQLAEKTPLKGREWKMLLPPVWNWKQDEMRMLELTGFEQSSRSFPF